MLSSLGCLSGNRLGAQIPGLEQPFEARERREVYWAYLSLAPFLLGTAAPQRLSHAPPSFCPTPPLKGAATSCRTAYSIDANGPTERDLAMAGPCSVGPSFQLLVAIHRFLVPSLR